MYQYAEKSPGGKNNLANGNIHGLLKFVLVVFLFLLHKDTNEYSLGNYLLDYIILCITIGNLPMCIAKTAKCITTACANWPHML